MKIFSLLAVSLCLFAISGCSIYSAAHAPGPVNYREIRVGNDRSDVITKFGVPRMSETSSEDRKDYFEFTDGYHQAWKGRILVYLAGDIFSFGLAEILFWPTEEFGLQGSEGRAFIVYNLDNKVKSIKVVSAKLGDLWYADPILPKLSSTELVPFESSKQPVAPHNNL